MESPNTVPFFLVHFHKSYEKSALDSSLKSLSGTFWKVLFQENDAIMDSVLGHCVG